MKKLLVNKQIKILHKNKLLFVKYLRDNPNTDIPMPDDIQIPEDLIYDEYTIPWIGILYYNPRIDVNNNVIIPFYCTDFYQCEYRYNIYKEFKLRYELDGEIGYKTIKAGDNEINFGKLSEGVHYYSLQVEDWNGNLSRRLFNDIWIYDKSNYEESLSELVYAITDDDLLDFNINKYNSDILENMENNKLGLTNLFEKIKNEGYKKCILPNGTYRVNRTEPKFGEEICIRIPSNFTVDMNNSTFKLHPYDDREYGEKAKVANSFVLMVKCEDSHLINGTLEGDYLERLNNEWVLENGTIENSIVGSNGEFCATFGMQGCKFCSLENIKIYNTTGYNFGTGPSGGSQSEYGMNFDWNNWSDGIAIENGIEISKENRTTSALCILSDKLIADKYIVASVYLGFGHIQSNYWDFDFHFYNENQEFLETIRTYQFTRCRIPNNAKYFRMTFKAESATAANLSSLTIHHLRVCRYCELNNCTFLDNRTCAAIGQSQHFTVQGCKFTRSGQSITPCEIDMEDGWEQIQDIFIRNNEIIESLGTTNIIAISGLNHLYEYNKNIKFDTRYRLCGITARHNTGGTIKFSVAEETLNTIRCYNNYNLDGIVGVLNFYPGFFGEDRMLPVKIKECDFIPLQEVSTSNLSDIVDSNIYISGKNMASCKLSNCTIYLDSKTTKRATLKGNIELNNCIYKLYKDSEDLFFPVHQTEGKIKWNNCNFDANCIFTPWMLLNDIEWNNCVFNYDVTINLSDSIENCNVIFKNCTFNGNVNYTSDKIIFENCIYK